MAKTRVAPKVSISDSGEVTVELYTPHAGQKRLHNSKTRFRVMACGRRWGKTLACANEIAKFAIENDDTTNVWVSPVYHQCKVVYRLLKMALKPLIVKTNETELRIELINGSVIEFYSAVKPDTIRGNGFSFFVIDECQDVDGNVWYKVIRPTLATTNGKGIFIGTPKGRNFFWNLFVKGEDPLQPEWESFTFPSSDNPYIPEKEIEDARRDSPHDVFEQEFLAIFLADSAGLFHNIPACIVGTLEDGGLTEAIKGRFYISRPPQKGYGYVIGWDVAKHEDFSVCNVLNIHTMHVDAFLRINQENYQEQVRRVKRLAEAYNDAYILQDITGVGDPVFEMLTNDETYIDASGKEHFYKAASAEGFLYNNLSKKMIIDELRIAIENKDITYPDIPVQINELVMMQYKVTPGRTIQYEAPPGHHDDCPNSLALAKHAAGTGRPVPIKNTEEDEENDMYTYRHFDNEDLMERQERAAQLLGRAGLVARFGDEDE